jgi:excisionase family DNA binding protein
MYKRAGNVIDMSELNSLPILLTVHQAAKIGSVSEKHIRDQFNKGNIAGCRIGQAIRINRDAYLTQLGLKIIRGVN